MPELEIKELTKKRGHIKARLTKFSGYLQELSDKSLCAARVTELQLRITKLESLFNTYDDIQTQLEFITDDDERLLDERSDFEDLYYSLVAAAKELVKLNTKVDGAGDGWSNSGRRHSQVKCKLPTISLPKFDGSYETWLEFHDTFDSLIHKDESIDDVNKFHYLRASLQGSAALVIQSLALSSSNYQIAWQLICDRYNNTRLLVNNHVTAIFNINAMHKESPLAIRYLIDTLCKNLRALGTLKEPTQYWDTLLIYLTCQKLDSVTRREWEQYVPSLEKVTFEALINFLRDRADLLETMALSSADRRASWPPGHGAGAAAATRARFSAPRGKEKCFVGLDTREYNPVSSPPFTPECTFCKQRHFIFECPKFLALSNKERADKVKGMKVCLNCLKPGHIAKYCRRGPCRSCSGRHNTLIHVNSVPSEVQVAVPVLQITAADEQSEQEAGPSYISNSGVTLPVHPVVQGQVLLSTALVHMYGYDNTVHVARALLDNGSTSSFMTENLWRKLNLPSKHVTASVSGITNNNSKLTKICQTKFKSLYDNNYCVQTSYFILPEITSNLPLCEVNLTMLDIPQHLVLADPKFYLPAAVDLLLGADVYFDLLGNGRLTLGRNKPTIYETKLGWVVSGSYANPNPNSVRCNFVQLNNLDDELTRFWKLDEATIKPASAYYSDEEKACEDHFVQNTTRLSDGRFMVKYPLKQPTTALGNSYERAKQCFLSLERRLERQPTLKTMYHDFMKEYEMLGDMSKITVNETLGNFLPHHGVLRLSSLTTKLRVVFNASSKTSTGVSLNDIQLVGPTIQDDLISILLRFRQYRFVYTSDVEKMYRRIVVHPNDRNLQQILWRTDPSEPLSTYQLNTVTYGTASAPFLAVRCLKQLSLECVDPALAEIIANDFYMDDFLSGSDTIDEAKQIISQVSETLKGAGMSLRKWRSNELDLVNDPSVGGSTDLNLGNLDDSKTLGLGWKSSTDELYYTIDLGNYKEQKVTKRLILSTVAKIFDPLGLVSPVIIQCKVLLQQLWLSKLAWDDEVPQDIVQKWNSIISSLPELNYLRIPRCVIGNASRREFHVFTDSSQTAYGACLYVRIVTGEGVVTRLLMAKSRVAPIKPVTIPRLELCGALVGAQLYKKALTSLRMTGESCTFWTDSMIVLGWLRMLPSQLKVFVRNRVADIIEITGGWPWRHVPTKENPADLVSRGLNASSISNAQIWWNGPPFLQLEEKEWPINHYSQDNNSPDINAEVVSNIAIGQTSAPMSELNLTKFSQFSKLKRVTAYVLRFLNNAKINTIKNSGPISTHELQAAMCVLVKLAQIESFPSYDLIKNKIPTNNKDPLTKLNPFIDSNGLIRVGGRLNNAPYNFDVKHPVILPNRHYFVKLYFEFVHIHLLHALPQAMLSYVKSMYWPIGGRAQARSIYNKCVLCSRMRGATVAPLMGSLPSPRVTPGFPFETVGVDYAGPIMAASRKGRGGHLTKVYIVIFVCFKTKCLHLELCSDLTADGYMAVLRRFISRRGLPTDIWSDNGKNFVGAYNDLKRFLASNAKELTESTANIGIQFHFVPPYSPHFGGLWEAGVKSTKHHLVRVLGNCHLTYEEICSTLCQIEAILNSRPLTPMSNDPSDLLPLTPGHFIIGRPLTALPTPCLTDINPSRLKRYQRIEQLKQHFWNRWQKEYVSELQERSKWKQSKSQLARNTMVVIKEDNLPPLKWKLGRIVAVIPGADGINRVADIRTASGIIRRSFSKICPLPVEMD